MSAAVPYPDYDWRRLPPKDDEGPVSVLARRLTRADRIWNTLVRPFENPDAYRL